MKETNQHRVLVLGGTGMLGHKLVQRLTPHFEVWTTTRESNSIAENYELFSIERLIEHIDVENEAKLAEAIESLQPQVLINAVGIIKQRPSSSDVITTLGVNSILPHRLKQLSEKYGFYLICISTDCVFLGDKGNYHEDEPADALDLYGRSKNLGEVTGENCLTVRTSIIGRELRSGHGLVEWFLSNRGKEVNGFVNAIYSGFPTIVFADIILNLLQRETRLNGLYHISSDPINKFELLELVNREYGAGVKITPFEDFTIDRSLNSSKFRKATGFVPPTWPEMIKRMAADTTPYEQWRR